ncbi:MAG TPA: penicillin-binding protein activator [Kofleriaceae bacterium]|nr:penicillin-binding protein activator [Kofleriaceae bacterium]
MSLLRAARRCAAIGALICAAACGPRPGPGEPSWIERDVSTHAVAAPRDATRGGVNGPAAPGPLSINELDEAAARAALEAAGDGAPADKLALRLARLAHHRGDDTEASQMLARAGRAADAAEVAEAAGELRRELVTAAVDPALIAVLLPLSGPYAGLGGELRAAIALAPADGVRWLYLDTRGTADGAAAAVEAAAGKGAIGVLGPVGQREAIAAARVAALHGMPIGLLAPADGADPEAGVFRLVASPADEGRAVAQLAAQDGFPTVGVLAPRDDVGRDAAEAFAAEAARLGLQVTAQGSYDPTGGDVEADVRAFLGLVPARNPRLAAHLARHGKAGWTTFSPDVAFTLLYVPDRYDRAAIVAAFLPYYNVELRTGATTDPDRLARKHGGQVPQIVQLIGGAGWHHPTLPVRGGPAVQGALIVDDFAGELGGDAAVQFAAEFQQRTHRTPSTAAAEVRDAAALIAAARAEAAQAGARTGAPRAALRAALAHARLDDGACGPATIAPDGELERTPSVLEVDGDTLILAP